MLGGRFHPKIRALRFIQKSERSVFPKNLGARYRPKIWALGFTPKSGRFVLFSSRYKKLRRYSKLWALGFVPKSGRSFFLFEQIQKKHNFTPKSGRSVSSQNLGAPFHFEADIKNQRFIPISGPSISPQSLGAWFHPKIRTLRFVPKSGGKTTKPSNFFLFFRRDALKEQFGKDGQMLGREKYFARNTTSSQRKRSCAAKYNWKAGLPVR